MPCPTCDATMELIGLGIFHCPRCGTVLNAGLLGAVVVPKLVGRCQQFQREMGEANAGLKAAWAILGIREAVSRPEQGK